MPKRYSFEVITPAELETFTRRPSLNNDYDSSGSVWKSYITPSNQETSEVGSPERSAFNDEKDIETNTDRKSPGRECCPKSGTYFTRWAPVTVVGIPSRFGTSDTVSESTYWLLVWFSTTGMSQQVHYAMGNSDLGRDEEFSVEEARELIERHQRIVDQLRQREPYATTSYRTSQAYEINSLLEFSCQHDLGSLNGHRIVPVFYPGKGAVKSGIALSQDKWKSLNDSAIKFGADESGEGVILTDGACI